MRSIPRVALMKGAASLCVVALAWSLLLGAGAGIETDFEADETIESLSIRLDIGADGADLNEPVALDLGLGFPLWLHPVGRQAGETLPFGAVPQNSSEDRAVRAGSSTTYKYQLSNDSQQDKLQTAPQLLANVRISDIARVGFASQGVNNWSLKGYELKVNGRVFAANDDVNLKAREAQDVTRFRIAELDLSIGPLETEAIDLRALDETGLATDADRQRLADVDAALIPLLQERRQLQSQVQGVFPWFIDPTFESPWRTAPSVEAVKVTLMTHAHAGADTRNYVYFRTGGHKYLLGSPETPLNGVSGAQEFALDLLAGPLTAADLRGYAVGMLAHGQPNGQTPDRWHPQRILVEVDGRLVYDSDENSIDRMSLESIRLIPPSHVGADAESISNTPTARETFVWEAGTGVGLDLVHGGAAELPPADDPAYPGAEPGLDPDNDFAEADAFPDFPPDFPPFPGEAGPCGGCVPVWPVGGWSGWDPGSGPAPDWLDWLFAWLLNQLPLPPGVNPPPAGVPFQVDSVQITEGWKQNDPFKVEWTVSGDESDIDHYEVELLILQPEIDPPIVPGPLATAAVPAGTHQLAGVLLLPIVGPSDYLLPKVTAVPTDPLAPPHMRFGPAKPLFTPTTPPGGQPGVANLFIYLNPPAPGGFSPVSFGGEPAVGGRAVWLFGQEQSHVGFLIDNPHPGYNIAVRPEPGDTEIQLHFNRPFLTGKHTLVAHVGFLGGPDAANSVDVELRCRLYPNGPGPVAHDYGVKSVSLVNPVGGPPVPMKFLKQEIDTLDAGAGPWRLRINFVIKGGAVDPDHPPALFGVRLLSH